MTDLMCSRCNTVLAVAQQLLEIPCSFQHTFFPGAKTMLAFPKLKIADNFCHLGQVMAGELFQIGLISA